MVGKQDLGDLQDGEQPLIRENSFTVPVGYKHIDNLALPSKGMFYQDDFHVSCRGLNIDEVKHYSMIDENSNLDIENHLNQVLDKACKISVGDRNLSYKDLKLADKLYIIFVIRDMTMNKHNRQVNLRLPSVCSNGHISNLTIDSEMFSFYKINEKFFESYYDSNLKCFNIPKYDLRIYIPSIGVAEALFQYVKHKEELKQKGDLSGATYNKEYFKFLLLLIPDFRNLTIAKIDAMMKKYNEQPFSIEKFEALESITRRISISIEPSVTHKCDTCEEEVTTQIRFPKGYRSIFYLTSVDSELFGD